jgi:hypothetical protein
MERQRRKLVPAIKVKKYRNTRYWAVWMGRRMLVVTAYKKGAFAIQAELIREQEKNKPTAPKARRSRKSHETPARKNRPARLDTRLRKRRTK